MIKEWQKNIFCFIIKEVVSDDRFFNRLSSTHDVHNGYAIGFYYLRTNSRFLEGTEKCYKREEKKKHK